MSNPMYRTGFVFSDISQGHRVDTRVATGVRKTTVALPDEKNGFVRINKNTPWNYQHENFDDIQEILARHGKRLTRVSMYTDTDGIPHYQDIGGRRAGRKVNLTSFVALCTDTLVWQKYEGRCAGGGQNTVYVGGEKMKLTTFLDLSKAKQDKLIRASGGTK